MKKLVTISLFIFWAVVTAVLTSGLIFYQNRTPSPGVTPTNSPAGSAAGLTGEITLSAAEIAKHNSYNNCWLIINNKIYNVTSFLSLHPGGAGTMTPYCGQEATNAFNTKDKGQPHSSSAVALLANYYIGDLNQKIGQQQVQQNIQQTNAVDPSIRGGFGDD